MQPQPAAWYAKQLRDGLPADVFKPAPRRLAWLVLHLAVVTAGIFVIGNHVAGWVLTIPAALMIGHSFGVLALLGHETLHGSVVRKKLPRLLIGWLTFLPFTLSPRLWNAWHNRVHHGHTGEAGVDPDAFPTLAEYRATRGARVGNRLTMGLRRWAGMFGLFLGFTVQSFVVLLGTARRRRYLSTRQYQAAVAETAIGIGLWAGLAIWIGFVPFIFAFLIPLVIGNAVVMSYILTNHGLSPLTAVNDPLLNSLSVTTPRIVDVLHLNFGYHVEHHLFPGMSLRHGPRVRAEVRKRWPERYQSMPLLRALAAMWRSARVYGSATTLLDPATGRRWPTLCPRPMLADQRATRRP
jgi:fatty acid desaturase